MALERYGTVVLSTERQHAMQRCTRGGAHIVCDEASAWCAGHGRVVFFQSNSVPHHSLYLRSTKNRVSKRGTVLDLEHERADDSRGPILQKNFLFARLLVERQVHSLLGHFLTSLHCAGPPFLALGIKQLTLTLHLLLELCLTLPARLSSLLPYLHMLMRPVLHALKALRLPAAHVLRLRFIHWSQRDVGWAHGECGRELRVGMGGDAEPKSRLGKLVDGSRSEFLSGLSQIPDSLVELHDKLKGAISEDAPREISDGGIFKGGYNPELDEIRDLLGGGKTWISEYQAKQQEVTGVKSLKVSFNKTFGYYIEVTKANQSAVPDTYIRKQTLTNAERFITPELKEYEAKISSGKIYELAEVVRDLNKGDDLMVDQSYSERQLFEKAYERILSEFKIILNLSLEDTQKKLDKALKRNLEGQNKTQTPITKNPTSELTDEEPISENDTEEPLGD